MDMGERIGREAKLQSGGMLAKVLVIEDNEFNLELVTDLLESRGHRVISATKAIEGIALAQCSRPDVILIDISLPGMDGIEATRRLKSQEQTARIPVIAVTAHAMKGDKERALGAGCSGYITKPIDTRKFVTQVESFLSPQPAFDGGV